MWELKNACYNFKCPCCSHSGKCSITWEEKQFLKVNYNTLCPAKDEKGITHFDFYKKPIYEVFKEFHESLKIMNKLRG